MRKVQITTQLRTTSGTIRRLGERFNASDVTNDSTRTERPRVTTQDRDRHFVTSHTYASGRDSKEYTWFSFNDSTTGPFIETWMCCGE